jgi:signal transduction histidine kinase
MATPLTIIQHSTQFARRNLADAPRYLDRIEKASLMISEISRSVREFQALEEGRMTLPLCAVNLDQLMKRILDLNEERLREKSLTLEWIHPENEPLLVLAEEKTLGNSVINNILSNAIKFSFEGQKILIGAIADGDFIELRIRDHGVGIAADKLRSLYSQQGLNSTPGTWGEKGTGFGLSISKAYVEKYGGEFRVESVEQKQSLSEHGTTVSLRLKRAHSPQQTPIA